MPTVLNVVPYSPDHSDLCCSPVSPVVFKICKKCIMLSLINHKNKQRKKPQKTPNKKPPKPLTLWPISKTNLSQETVRDILKILQHKPYTKTLLLRKYQICNSVHRETGKY